MSITWPSDVFHDYSAAAITLVTATHAKQRHLLFAQVELYPKEIPLPPKSVEPLRKNIGDTTIFVSVSVVSIEQALAWYQSALAGNLALPNLSGHAVVTLKLAPEPAMGHFLASTDIPFAAAWHANPRIHRLVPLEEISPTILGAEEKEKYAQIREWLANLLNFDLLAFDDFLCSVVLLAPNPIARGIHSHIKELLPDGRERLRIKAHLRDGYSSETLRIRFREQRPGGTSIIECQLDKYGMADIVLPQLSEQSGLEIVCDTRGLLSIETMAHHFRGANISFTSTAIVEQGSIPIPPRKKEDEASVQTLFALQPAPDRILTDPVDVRAAARLLALQTRREARAGIRRPDGFILPAENDQRIFASDRLEAVTFIHRLIRQAKRQVIFVDPYFNFADIVEFALGYQYEGVRVSILTSMKFADSDETTGRSKHKGDELERDLLNLETRLMGLNRKLPDFKLMLGGVNSYHDRFLVIDEMVWHFGHSFNKIGDGQISMVTKLTNPSEIRQQIFEDVDKAEFFLVAWPKIKADIERSATSKNIPGPLTLRRVFLSMKAAFTRIKLDAIQRLASPSAKKSSRRDRKNCSDGSN